MLQQIRDQLVPTCDQWIPARLALARSLQIAEPPSKSDYVPLGQQNGGVDLHSRNLTGEGADRPENDLTEIFRTLLSVYEGRDLFNDEQVFHEALQRHVRRGIRAIVAEWQEAGNFMDYLANNLLHDDGMSTAITAEADDLPDRIMRVLGELGVDATLEKVERGPRLTRLTLHLHAYEELERIRRSVEQVKFALGLGDEMIDLDLAQGQEQRIHLTVPRPPSAWQTVTWSEVSKSLGSDKSRRMGLAVCVGTDVLGTPFIFDLATAPHLLVGGTTGSGKSMCLHAILLSLLEDQGRPQLVLVDPKQVEFSTYERSSRLRGPIVHSAPDVLETLDDLVLEMDRRQDLFRELGVREFEEAKRRGPDLRRIVVVIDELNDLLMQSRDIELPLIRLAQKARFSGIHLVLATQRPEAATFSGQLRSNVPSRIALTVQKSSESRIILDEIGAETLLGKGDMLVKMSGKQAIRAHGCRVDHADIVGGVALA